MGMEEEMDLTKSPEETCGGEEMVILNVAIV